MSAIELERITQGINTFAEAEEQYTRKTGILLFLKRTDGENRSDIAQRLVLKKDTSAAITFISNCSAFSLPGASTYPFDIYRCTWKGLTGSSISGLVSPNRRHKDFFQGILFPRAEAYDSLTREFQKYPLVRHEVSHNSTHQTAMFLRQKCCHSWRLSVIAHWSHALALDTVC